MFGIGKKTLLAVGGYLLGGLVATLFSEKKGKKIREDLEEVKGDKEKAKDIIINNFIETHKNLLDSLKKNVLTEENKEIFNEKVSQAKELVKEYKKQGEELIEELKEKGIDYADVAKEKLEKLYEEKKSTLSELKEQAPEKLEKTKEKLLTKLSEVKEKITK